MLGHSPYLPFVNVAVKVSVTDHDIVRTVSQSKIMVFLTLSICAKNRDFVLRCQPVKILPELSCIHVLFREIMKN